MAKTSSRRKTRSDKFPLTLHPTGQYCKKIRGKMYYFGTNKKQALERHLQRASTLHLGRDRDHAIAGNGITVKALCNLYLDHQHSAGARHVCRYGKCSPYEGKWSFSQQP